MTDEPTRQLQAGQMYLAFDRITDLTWPQDDQDDPMYQAYLAEGRNLIHWMTIVTGYTKAQLEVFAHMAADLNDEVAHAERAAGWDPNP